MAHTMLRRRRSRAATLGRISVTASRTLQTGDPTRRAGTTRNAATLLAIGALSILMQSGGQAVATLPYSRSFLVTGDYAVGGVDLREAAHPIVNGFSTAPIPMAGVPANADIIAAYLFWETVTTGGDAWLTEATGVRFRGFPLDVANPLSVVRTEQPSAGARCFGSGSLSMHMFMADVLRFLPVKVDSAGKPTGKRLVNDADLQAQQLDRHEVTLPVRDGNAVPESAGASLVVVYRNPAHDPVANPLKKILIYSGNVIKPDVATSVDLTIAGIYRSSVQRSARITHILSSGQPNSNLKVTFKGAGNTVMSVAGSNPFTAGPASQRWWANPTQNVTLAMTPGGNTGAYGETVSTSIFHSPSNGSYDCVASGAVVFSTAVADVDEDGLPDALEDAPAPLLDANGAQLPDLHAMGAGDHGSGNKPDIFIEVNAMKASPGTSYGSATAPYSDTLTTKVDAVGHHHMPTPYMLRMVGDAYAAHDIRVHFDVGSLDAYRTTASRCLPAAGETTCTPTPGIVQYPDFVDDYTSHEADAYLIATGVRGGEVITETACDPARPGCHFPAFPGAVPWKLGLQAHRDSPVDAATGGELQDFTAWDGVRRRFDPERRGLFKYLLYAHSRGNPKSLPCLIDGVPMPYLDQGIDTDGSGPDTDTPNCAGMDNPDFDANGYHVPTSASGVADLPGANLMVTLGFWDEYVGRPFVRASTTFHELGHTVGLLHGGPETELTAGGSWQPGAVVWGTPTTPTFAEPNCKPNYLSSMSYLFQAHGLFDDSDRIHLDYSWAARNTLNESSLVDDPMLPLPPASIPRYQAAWFAPAESALALRLGAVEAKRYCSGEKFAVSPHIARVHAETANEAVDWNGNELIDLAPYAQDVNFDNDGSTRNELGGFSDWDNIRLNQNGASVSGTLSGSAEGSVWFDNSGSVWFDNSGSVWFDNAGGVFFDNSGSVWFDNSGSVWFDNAGGVWFDTAGGVFFDNSGSVWFDNAGGVFFDNSGQEITYEDAKSFGRGRPHRTGTCVIGDDAIVSQDATLPVAEQRFCSAAQPNTFGYHRIEVIFEQLQVGGIEDYLIERRSQDALGGTPDQEFATAGTVAAHLVRFTDPAELANGIDYIYRVRGRSSDEFGNSGWSRSVTETAVNIAPVASDDAYSVAGGSTLTVNAPGVLGNDTQDVDSPPTSRRVFTVTSGPSHGTLSMNANGSFTYTPTPGYVGADSFTYAADNGAWSGNPAVPLSPPSNAATVAITVTNAAPACGTLLTASVQAGTSTVLSHNCTDPNGDALTVTSIGPVAGAGTAAVTTPVSASFTYTAPSTVAATTTATFAYTVSDGKGGTASGNAKITVTPRARHGFVNVQNLPPAGDKSQKTGSTVPLRWQWTNASGVPINTAGQAIVKAYACSTGGVILPGVLIGAFDPSKPGSGNSFSFSAGSNTWSFNWKLWYVDAGVTRNLPVGTYVVQVINSVTQQTDPVLNNTCGGQVISGALVKVVKQ